VNPGKNKNAEVVFTQPPLQCFTYAVPSRFLNDLRPGHRVVVPLKNRRVIGFVVKLAEESSIRQLKEIEDICDPYPLLTPELVKLTRWVSEYYLSSWGDVIRTSLPPGMHRKSRIIIEKIDHEDLNKRLSETQKKILSIIEREKKTTLNKIKMKTNIKGIRWHLYRLESAGLIKLKHVLDESDIGIKSEKWIYLKSDPDPDLLNQLKKRAPRQYEVIMHLKDSDGMASKKELSVELSVLNRLKQKGMIEILNKEVFRDPYSEITKKGPKPVKLTEDQKSALKKIRESLNREEFRVFLIHGVTASGKTQVYIESIRHALNRGKSALVLIPEISLTPQAVSRYRAVFGDSVAVLHSRMSQGERYDSWRKIREGSSLIALGPRSTVFAPLKNLGLIIVDEEHDTSYKQMNPSPRYNARDVAVMRGKINGCVVILGSATPSLESYFNTTKGKYELIRLPNRIDNTPLPKITVVDQKESRNDVFTDHFIERMKTHLERGEQIILLQNRRGYSSFLRCRDCGYIEHCPNCDISLTYHKKNYLLICHYCDFKKKPPDTCSRCGGSTLNYRGVGTQRVEAELNRLFPDLKTIRMDLDSTRRKGSHDHIIREFEKGSAKILIGTQMVAKGHDFPDVNFVGIISADTGLYFPDFRSTERTFHLLTQAAGRAGRRRVQGEVVIQTYSTDSPVLRFAQKQDYDAFYNHESTQRKELNYPPWGKLILLRFISKSSESAERASKIFSDLIKEEDFFQKLGPAPSPISRIRDNYRYQMIFKSKKSLDPSGKKIREIIRNNLTIFYEKTYFPDVRITIDVDPVDMM